MLELTIEEILASLLLKVDKIKRLSTKKDVWVSENLDVLHIEIDFFQIKKDLLGYPYKEAISKLNEIKITISDLCISEFEMETLIYNLFLVEDFMDFKVALSIITDELKIFVSNIDNLIKYVYDSIPPEILLDKTLKLAFFEALITWTDTNGKHLIEVKGEKSDPKICEQLYALYREKPLKTAFKIDFVWEKNAVYYLLHWIASSNRTSKTESFVESPYFTINDEPIKYPNLRKGVNRFKGGNSKLKLLIDDYLKPYGSVSLLGF